MPTYIYIYIYIYIRLREQNCRTSSKMKNQLTLYEGLHAFPKWSCNFTQFFNLILGKLVFFFEKDKSFWLWYMMLSFTSAMCIAQPCYNTKVPNLLLFIMYHIFFAPISLSWLKNTNSQKTKAISIVRNTSIIS